MKNGRVVGGAPPEGVAPAEAGARAPHLPDLTHLTGPLTEDAVIKCLQAKFYANKFYVSIAEVLTSFECKNLMVVFDAYFSCWLEMSLFMMVHLLGITVIDVV